MPVIMVKIPPIPYNLCKEIKGLIGTRAIELKIEAKRIEAWGGIEKAKDTYQRRNQLLRFEETLKKMCP